MEESATSVQIGASKAEDADKALKQKIANGFKHLTEAFRHYDTDKDGFIDDHELRTAAVRAGIQLSKEEALRLMTMIDKDCNGNISAQEFMQFFSPGNSRRFSQIMKPQLPSTKKSLPKLEVAAAKRPALPPVLDADASKSSNASPTTRSGGGSPDRDKKQQQQQQQPPPPSSDAGSAAGMIVAAAATIRSTTNGHSVLMRVLKNKRKWQQLLVAFRDVDRTNAANGYISYHDFVTALNRSHIELSDSAVAQLWASSQVEGFGLPYRQFMKDHLPERCEGEKTWMTATNATPPAEAPAPDKATLPKMKMAMVGPSAAAVVGNNGDTRTWMPTSNHHQQQVFLTDSARLRSKDRSQNRFEERQLTGQTGPNCWVKGSTRWGGQQQQQQWGRSRQSGGGRWPVTLTAFSGDKKPAPPPSNSMMMSRTSRVAPPGRHYPHRTLHISKNQAHRQPSASNDNAVGGGGSGSSNSSSSINRLFDVDSTMLAKVALNWKTLRKACADVDPGTPCPSGCVHPLHFQTILSKLGIELSNDQLCKFPTKQVMARNTNPNAKAIGGRQQVWSGIPYNDFIKHCLIRAKGSQTVR
jgi:Ca2+-binding EF-hand superfamily protein